MTEMLRRDYINADAISKRLGKPWYTPVPFGDDGWNFEARDRRIFVTLDVESDSRHWWIHASIAYQDRWRIPSYSDLKQMHAAVFDNQHAYQCFVPPDEHVNITSNVLHLWGRYDGANVLPNFGRKGTI